jgi:uncharacterized protein (DUF488 family)
MLLTLGHSTHPIDEFLGILAVHGVQALADIRTIPRSRHNPQFNQDALRKQLEAAGIRYVHLVGLGGLRHPLRDSVNTGWRNLSFRGFADYMQTPAFRAALEQLIALSRASRVAMMCAEAVPWRCHRSLIADALTVRGVPVEHIMTAASGRAHTLTPFAQVDGDKITYTLHGESEYRSDDSC